MAVYDETGGAPHLQLSANAPAGGTCGTRPCWAENSAGFKYANKAATPDGLIKIALRAGEEGSAKISVKGKGVNLPVPALPLTPPVTAQLQASNGTCWDAVYSEPAADDTQRFSAKGE
jgi:hypothetical protein